MLSVSIPQSSTHDVIPTARARPPVTGPSTQTKSSSRLHRSFRVGAGIKFGYPRPDGTVFHNVGISRALGTTGPGRECLRPGTSRKRKSLLTFGD